MKPTDVVFSLEDVRDALVGASDPEFGAIIGLVMNEGAFRRPFSIEGVRERRDALLVVLADVFARHQRDKSVPR